MKKKISTYWKCQIAGWVTYLSICFVFGLVLGGIYYTTLLKAIIQFAMVGIFSTHLMRTVLLKMQILQKSLKMQILYFFCITLCFSILSVALFYCIEAIIGFYRIEMNVYSIFFIRTSIAFVSILMWNLIYFIYHYIEKSRKEEIEKIRLESKLILQEVESEKTKIELQQQKTELEMQALRAQMNPHFIFNSLNSIDLFILRNDKTKASKYLTKFSRLIRMILNSSANASVYLAEDLEALQLYLELERLRCDEKFSFKIKIDPNLDIDFIQVPPMLLQPFAENAIWHGLMNKEDEGHLWINIAQGDSMLTYTITDDGIGRKKAAELKDKSGKHKSMGMKITQSRIAMMQKMNGENKSVEIRDLVDEGGYAAGTEVVLKIPVMQ